jgi:hypothetical protein
VALDLATRTTVGEAAEGLLLLASELLRLEPSSRWINRPRALLSALLRWHRGELGLR